MKLHFSNSLLFCAVIFSTIIVYSFFRDVLISNPSSTQVTIQNKNDKDVIKGQIDFKYILQWTSDTNVPFVDMGKGQYGFLKRKCPFVNCFVTSDKALLEDYTQFDVIAFAGPEIVSMLRSNIYSFPTRRSLHQKYVFASIESADNYQMCTTAFDGYFNWTWTYKLDSEVQWGYIVIKDMQNNTIGPKKDMNWLKLEEMDPVTEEFKNKLKTKKKAVAWYVSNCVSTSRREIFFFDLQHELMKYEHKADMYGTCGNFDCPREREKFCDAKIAKDYYFYLSFENGLSEDYVTEKLLRALNNDAVPIVYGGANYTRFMPDGIYLNARELGVPKLAAKINELINNPDQYANYFKWKNHYSYHKTTESVETNEYCKICELLNNDTALKKTTVYEKFERWWNPTDSLVPCQEIIEESLLDW